MARIKGTNVVHTRAFIESSYGLEGWAAVGAELSKPDRDAIEGVLAVGWYPAELHVALLHAMREALSDREENVIRRAASHAVDYDVTRIHRVLFRAASPAMILEKAMDIWDRFYDTGEWQIARRGPTKVSAALRGVRDRRRAVLRVPRRVLAPVVRARRGGGHAAPARRVSRQGRRPLSLRRRVALKA